MVDITYHGTPLPTDRLIKTNGMSASPDWYVPEETPVAFVYNQRNYAVMLATPADLSDFAVGFSLTERVVDHVEEISKIDVHQEERGIDFRCKIRPDQLDRLDVRQQRRNMVGRAGCGVCGLENAEVFFEPLSLVADHRVSLTQAALTKAHADFDAHQPLSARTRTVHCAAWVSTEGEIRIVREDVGRHNALDKLIGALAISNADFGAGFVMISSRCSYEIIEKSARVGIKAVAALSGPTAFALKKATEANMALYCRSDNEFVAAVSD
ncbi:MAG: formate dehydrogenase accessory sulfurtransferase FdhD [Rhodospirillaceae bacterium]|nr:formate dehydrogenase accessory sulfurtransferase FdhD [Rhodospirillaceae bacterium]